MGALTSALTASVQRRIAMLSRDSWRQVLGMEKSRLSWQTKLGQAHE